MGEPNRLLDPKISLDQLASSYVTSLCIQTTGFNVHTASNLETVKQNKKLNQEWQYE